MNKLLNNIRASRHNLNKLLQQTSIEKLNEIPEALNNNLAWNLGHIVVSQQLLCYQFSNLPPLIDEGTILEYKTGTKPNRFIDLSEITLLTKQSISLIDKLETDLENNLFENYSPFLHPAYTIEIKNIDDAIALLLYHDGLHFGYSIALKKIIENNVI